MLLITGCNHYIVQIRRFSIINVHVLLPLTNTTCLVFSVCGGKKCTLHLFPNTIDSQTKEKTERENQVREKKQIRYRCNFQHWLLSQHLYFCHFYCYSNSKPSFTVHAYAEMYMISIQTLDDLINNANAPSASEWGDTRTKIDCHYTCGLLFGFISEVFCTQVSPKHISGCLFCARQQCHQEMFPENNSSCSRCF